MYRAGLLAAYGWKHAISSLRDRPIWVGDSAIRFSPGSAPDRIIADEGLILVPRTSSRGWWTCEGRTPNFALVYPAQGVGMSVDDRSGKERLDGLLGVGRSRIVRSLAIPATSTQLAALHRLSLGTVSAHLAVLRDADIVAGIRNGRSVVYQLTSRGRELLGLD